MGLFLCRVQQHLYFVRAALKGNMSDDRVDLTPRQVSPVVAMEKQSATSYQDCEAPPVAPQMEADMEPQLVAPVVKPNEIVTNDLDMVPVVSNPEVEVASQGVPGVSTGTVSSDLQTTPGEPSLTEDTDPQTVPTVEPKEIETEMEVDEEIPFKGNQHMEETVESSNLRNEDSFPKKEDSISRKEASNLENEQRIEYIVQGCGFTPKAFCDTCK